MIGQDGLVNHKATMTGDDKKKLYAVLSEMRARGMSIPKNIKLPSDTVSDDWGQDENGYFVKRDGTRFNPRQELVDFINDGSRFILLKSGRGGGKALAIDTPILTLSGWSSMGELSVGDYVFSEGGNPVKVIAKSEVMHNHKCYLVRFNDGSEIVADAEHLWFTQTKHERTASRLSVIGSIRETQGMVGNLLIGKRKEPNYSIPTCLPLRFPWQNLPIPPYLLGAWLGDGHSSGARFTTNDPEILTYFDDFGIESTQQKSKYGYALRVPNTENIRDGVTGRMTSNPNNLSSIFRRLGILNNKHIPQQYLYSSFEQRLELVRGLMDTDGTVDERGHCEFTSTNYRLACGVLELLLSLGIKANLSTSRAMLYGNDCGEKYRIYINTTLPIFRLKRKLKRLERGKKQNKRHENRHIVSIEDVKSVPVQCITVDSASHLYLAGKSLIPTHNSTAGVQKALRKVKDGQSGAVMNPDFENFRTSTWPELREWIPWKMVVPKHRYRASPSWEPIKPFSIVFINGATLYCKGLKDPESARGSNVNFFWYDEGRRDLTGLGWKNAIAFCRVGDNPQAWCTTTPAGTEHWTTKFFLGEMSDELKSVLAELLDKGISQNLFAIYKTSTKANQGNLDPFFYASLLTAYPSGYLRARELDGEAADEGGSLGDRMWFNGKELLEYPDWGMKYVRFWDMAATEKKILAKKKINDPDEAVGSLLCTDNERKLELKKYAICDQVSGFWEWKALKEAVKRTAEKDGILVPIVLEQEPASGGKNQVAAMKEWLAEVLPGYKVFGLEARKVGDRVMAANIWFGEASNGQFYYVKGKWNEGFFSQLDRFNGIFHDDKITSVTGARHYIAPIKQWSKAGIARM